MTTAPPDDDDPPPRRLKWTHVEKLCRKHVKVGRRFGRWIKRQTAKAWRRMAKADPDNAPKKRPTRGWSD